MNFYKNTKSYEFISIIEKLPFYTSLQRLKNSILFILKFEKYEFLMKRKINKKKISNKQIIDLYIYLFKEYFYLQEIISKINIQCDSVFNYNMIDNSIIDSSIVYNIRDNYIILQTQYNIITEEYNIYIDTSHININTSGFNLTEKNLNIFQIKDSIIPILNLILTDILNMILSLFGYYYKLLDKED